MTIIGKAVIYEKMLGVVLGYSVEEKYEKFLRVRIWNSDSNLYTVILSLPCNLIEIEDPIVLNLTNHDDLVARRSFLEVCVEHALERRDAVWFKEITDEIKELKENDIRLGDVVTELGGKGIGVVVSEANQDNMVEVMCFNLSLRNYFSYSKRLDLIKKVRDPRKLEEFNKQRNSYDTRIKDFLREAISDLALQTKDKEWYEKVNRKETADGA